MCKRVAGMWSNVLPVIHVPSHEKNSGSIFVLFLVCVCEIYKIVSTRMNNIVVVEDCFGYF